MRFIKLPLEGAYHIELEPFFDSRGFLVRSFCAETFMQQGLATQFVQCNISYNRYRGTLRGLHYQKPPFQESKLIRCTRGSVFDVLVDLRGNSKTYLETFSMELKHDHLSMIYIPAGIAHGFQALEDHTELFYQMSEPYQADYADGIRWNDPLFNIAWPIEQKILSERDQNLPLWKS